jgi:hypothetical protein
MQLAGCVYRTAFTWSCNARAAPEDDILVAANGAAGATLQLAGGRHPPDTVCCGLTILKPMKPGCVLPRAKYWPMPAPGAPLYPRAVFSRPRLQMQALFADIAFCMP